MPSPEGIAADVQGVADAVLSCAVLLGIPPVSLGAEGAKLLVDLGFSWFFHATEARLREAATAQAAGDAAEVSAAVTGAREAIRARLRAGLVSHVLQAAVERCTCGRWSLDLVITRTMAEVHAAWVDHVLAEIVR